MNKENKLAKMTIKELVRGAMELGINIHFNFIDTRRMNGKPKVKAKKEM